MSLFGYAKEKLHMSEHPANSPPLGLHPGTRIEIKDVPLIFAEAAGSIIKDIKRSAVIESIGFYTQGDMRVFRAYFDEENCFVEVPVKLTNLQTPVHIRIFKTRNEDFPDAGLRELLIGGDDNEEPLIGFFKFQINATENSPEIIYDRSWIAGTNVPRSVSPFNLNETIMDNTKTEIQHDDHSIMLYQRDLPENVIEYMYTDFVNQKRPDGQQAEVFRTFVGIEIKASDIEIFPV